MKLKAFTSHGFLITKLESLVWVSVISLRPALPPPDPFVIHISGYLILWHSLTQLNWSSLIVFSPYVIRVCVILSTSLIRPLCHIFLVFHYTLWDTLPYLLHIAGVSYQIVPLLYAIVYQKARCVLGSCGCSRAMQETVSFYFGLRLRLVYWNTSVFYLHCFKRLYLNLQKLFLWL